ncbi:MAG: hypothetical protein KF901_06505 [Myxococcales bacterium]|nr:hypothetical protein [Myxococcales bacterium]
MSSSIKPPGSRPPSAADAARPEAGPGERVRGERFDEVMGQTEASGAERATQSALPGEVARELAEGRLDAAAAVERLLADILSGPMAAGLDDRGRAALEAHLRATLEDDPNLAALVRDLER